VAAKLNQPTEVPTLPVTNKTRPTTTHPRATLVFTKAHTPCRHKSCSTRTDKPTEHTPNTPRTHLSNVVVCVALQLNGDALAQPGTQALPCMSCEHDVDGVIRQARCTKALSHLMAQCGAHCTVCVEHTKLDIPAGQQRQTHSVNMGTQHNLCVAHTASCLTHQPASRLHIRS
jgi:hypothetical protein